MMYVVLECCVHNITCKYVFSWVCGCRLHPKFKGKVVGEGGWRKHCRCQPCIQGV
jgi:hypothetical protein